MAASQTFHAELDVLMLATNLIKKVKYQIVVTGENDLVNI